MDGERYHLHFGPLRIGVVTESDRDFPNLWGTITYEPWVSGPLSPEEERLARFVALNKESIRLLDMESDIGTSPEQAGVNAELAASYMDYVESAEWKLVDGRGRDLPILCPILRGDSELVWRWNPGRR